MTYASRLSCGVELAWQEKQLFGELNSPGQTMEQSFFHPELQ